MSPDPQPPGNPDDDKAAELIHDLASEPPAKGLDTVKAASDAVGAQGGDGRDARIEQRAQALWEAAGHQGTAADYRQKAEAELAADKG